MEKKLVGIWIRVSTEDQAKGESPEHHEKRARLYAESRGWEVVTVYHLEAMSGKTVMAYPETQRMLADIRSGTITGLIFSKLARLARNTKELLDFSEIFKVENADLISLQESIDTSTPAGRLFYTMIAAMAQWEREEIVERISASVPIRAKLGKSLGGKPTLGYKWENKEVVIDEQFAPIRKLIFDLFLQTKRRKAVARMLNEQGYRTTRGGLFSDTTIYHLLRDPSAKGERRANFTTTKFSKNKNYGYKPESEWVIHPCPAIVSAEVWDECNRILDESQQRLKRMAKSPVFLLSGYLTCENCSKTMYVFYPKTKAPVYYCKDCKTKMPVADIDEIYHEQLKTFLLTETSTSDYLQKIDVELLEKEKLLKSVSEERATIKKKMDGLIELRLEKSIPKEILEEKSNEIGDRLKALGNQVAELEASIAFLKIERQSSDVILQDAKDLYSAWHTLTFDQKRHIIEQITEKILIGKEDITIQLSHLPSKKPAPRPTPLNGRNGQNDAVDILYR